MSLPPIPARSLRVFAVAVLGIALFSTMDAIIKDLVLAIGTYTTLLWRNVAGAVLSGALYASRRPPPPTRAALEVHAIRGVITTGMALCFFWGLARVPLAQAVALTFIAPLLSLFLAAAMLGERVTPRMVSASCIALAGVIVIVAGQWHAEAGPDATLGTIAILVSALCYAVNIVLMRRQALVAGPVEVAFSQSVVVAALLALGGPFFADLPAPTHVPALVVTAVLATISLMVLAWAYARGEASYLSTSEYTAFIWAALLGWFFFGERLAVTTVVGTALIVAGCILAARQKPSTVVPPEITQSG